MAETRDLVGGRGGDADLVQSRGIGGSQHGDAEQEQVGIGLLLGRGRGAHHLAATRGVQREHLDGERAEGLDGLGDGVGDVVQLQVEEDVEAQVGDLAHVVRPVGGEHLEAELHPAEIAAQLAENGRGFFTRWNVEGQDQITGHFWSTTNAH